MSDPVPYREPNLKEDAAERARRGTRHAISSGAIVFVVGDDPCTPLATRLGIVGWRTLIKPGLKRSGGLGKPPLSIHIQSHRTHRAAGGTGGLATLHQPAFEAIRCRILLCDGLKQVALDGHPDGIGRGITLPPLPASLGRIQRRQ